MHVVRRRRITSSRVEHEARGTELFVDLEVEIEQVAVDGQT
jgi:hypothetical protein